jgi:type II secretory pathway component PulF
VIPRFRFRAAAPSGKLVRGIVAAENAAEVAALLRARGLEPVATTLAAGVDASQRTNRRELAIVFRSLATLVGSGVPVDRALASTEAIPRGRSVRGGLAEARRLLHEGRTLADALDASRVGVPGVTLGILRAGERGGRVGPALLQAAVQLEREAELNARIHQALAYPMVLLAAGTVSVGVIATTVVPRFAVLLADVHQALPPATRLLITTADLVRRFWLALLVTGLLVVIGFLRWAGEREGKRTLQRWLLALPVLGPIRLGLATARVARALAGLLAAGVPLLGALAAAEEAAGDAEVASRLTRVRNRVAGGETLSRALSEEGALTHAALQLFMVGESSGELAVMADRAGELAAFEAEGGLRVLVGLAEPALVIVFGGLVAFVAAALLQAVYSLRPM